jgi:zinc transporter
MTNPIQFALGLSGPEPGARLDEAAIIRALADDSLAWAHLSATDPASDDWIRSTLSYLPAPVRLALTAEATRPRVSLQDNGVLVILRGVNTNPGADPEDMVSVRMWIDPARIVSLSRRPVAAVADLHAQIERGTGPTEAGAFLSRLIDGLNAGIVERVDRLEEKGEDIEDRALSGHAPEDLRPAVTDIRRELAVLRRFLRPQRDAVALLAAGRLDWIDPLTRLHLGEAQDHLTRIIEILDGLTERMALARDEVASLGAERLNRNLYRLAVLSAVFLPLTFLTGLMGINLGGMPGAQALHAFWIFSAGLAVLLVLLLLLLWRYRRS